MNPRPRSGSDLVLVEQIYRGEPSYIVKDPTTHKYFRFRPVEVAVMRALDGIRHCGEAAAALAEAGIRVSAATVGEVRREALAHGPDASAPCGSARCCRWSGCGPSAAKRLGPGPFRGELLRMRWSMGDPDAVHGPRPPVLRFCFTRGSSRSRSSLFAVHSSSWRSSGPSSPARSATCYRSTLRLGNLFALWFTGLGSSSIHELGHGYTCKYFGGQVHEIGSMLFYFEPAFFCNVNDAWTFPELRARLWVTAAGSWIQMVVASVAAVVWWAAAPDTLLSAVALSAVLMGGSPACS